MPTKQQAMILPHENPRFFIVVIISFFLHSHQIPYEKRPKKLLTNKTKKKKNKINKQHTVTNDFVWFHSNVYFRCTIFIVITWKFKATETQHVIHIEKHTKEYKSSLLFFISGPYFNILSYTVVYHSQQGWIWFIRMCFVLCIYALSYTHNYNGARAHTKDFFFEFTRFPLPFTTYI